MIRVRTVEHIGGYKLRLGFSDGSAGVVDLRHELKGPSLSGLKDSSLFAKAHVEDGTVVWPGGLDFAAEYFYALAHKLSPPRTFDDAQKNEQAVSLKELRHLAGKTQTDVADEMGVDQGEVSRLEHRDDAKLSTLRAYVEALGGKLELTAKVGDRSVALQAFLPPGKTHAGPVRKTKASAPKRARTTLPKRKKA